MIKNVNEEIILKMCLVSHLDIIVTDIEKIVYYMGSAERCSRCMYAPTTKKFNECANALKDDEIKFIDNASYFEIVEDESVFDSLAIAQVNVCEGSTNYAIFAKLHGNFTEREKFLIRTCTYLLRRGF